MLKILGIRLSLHEIGKKKRVDSKKAIIMIIRLIMKQKINVTIFLIKLELKPPEILPHFIKIFYTRVLTKLFVISLRDTLIAHF